MDTSKTALIVGAGPAGLTAAYELLKTSSIKPVILEKESFVAESPGQWSTTATGWTSADTAFFPKVKR